MLEWDWTLALDEVRFANGLTLLEGSPFAALKGEPPVATLGLGSYVFRSGGDLDFWRWLIRKPFRLGLGCRLPLPG